MDLLLQALSGAFAPSVILYLVGGVFLGVTVGAIPGLGPTMAMAILLPLTYKLAPATSLGMLIGIYKGSIFGGSISSISFGVPGTPAAAATVEDGYKAKSNYHRQRRWLDYIGPERCPSFYTAI